MIWFFRWRNSSFLTQMFPIYQASGWNAEKGVTLANGQFIPDEVPSPWAAQCSALLSRRDAAVRYSFNTKVYSSYIDDISVGRQGLCAHFFRFTNAADQRKFKVHVPLKIPTSPRLHVACTARCGGQCRQMYQRGTSGHHQWPTTARVSGSCTYMSLQTSSDAS